MMWMPKKYMVRVLVKGGILTPSYLLNIINLVKSTGKRHVYFGSRQDLLFEVSHKQMPKIKEAFEQLQISYIVQETKNYHYQNIVSSYVSADMVAATSWLSSGNYLYILESFNYHPELRINIADPKQSLVPLFSGNLNYIASPVKDFWYLYVRKSENAIPQRWPVLVLNSDIVCLSKTIENQWFKVNYNFGDFFENIRGELEYTWRKIETTPLFENIPPQDYEGFGKMYSSQNYWAGFYWCNNKYDLAFLEEVCQLCFRTNISKICLTPWKSFLVKEIHEKDLFHWHRLLGRFGINMRHSSFELNWHVPLQDKNAMQIKRFVVKKFDKVDVCVHGLTFGIKTNSEPSFTSIVIERKPVIKFLKGWDPFMTYTISHSRDFNVNNLMYDEYMSQVSRYHLPKILQNITSKYYAQLHETNLKPEDKIKVEKEDKHIVYQCIHCFSIYDETTENGQKNNHKTTFENLPVTYCCALCEAPKADFRKTFMSHLIKQANQ